MAKGKESKSGKGTKSSTPIKKNEMDMYRTQVPEKGPNTDLVGFSHTVKNDPAPGQAPDAKSGTAGKGGKKSKNQLINPGKQQIASPIFNEEYFEPFDVCFAFPKTFKPKKENKVVPAKRAEKIIMKILCARDTDATGNYNDVSALHKAYGLAPGDIQRDYTQGELRNLFMEITSKVINRVGCFTVKSESSDGKWIIVRCKLEEESCKRQADMKNYPLKMDYNVTSFDQFKQDPTFVAPFVPYERCIERTTRDGSAMDKIGHVWQRYDRISRDYNHSFSRGDQELSIFRDIDRTRILMDTLTEYINVQIMDDKGYVQAFPLHQPSTLHALKKSWGSFRLVWNVAQPLDQICAYFGEKLALYYAWLQLYCWMLVIPSLFGLGLYVTEMVFDHGMNYNQGWLNYIRVMYCAVVAAWASWFYQLWQRKESILCLRWGSEVVTGNKCSPVKSPWFKPTTTMADPIHPHGKVVQTVPPAHRIIRKLIAYFIVSFLTITAVMVVNDEAVNAFLRMFGILSSESKKMTWEGLLGKGEGASKAAKTGGKAVWFVAYLPLVILVKLIGVLWDRMLIQAIAKFENNPYFEQYYRSVTLYSFVFKFANHLLPMMYLAFLKEYFGDLCDDMDDGRCVKATRKMLQSFFTAGLVGNIMEIGMPFIKQFLGKRKANKALAANGGNHIPFYELQIFTKMYDTRAQIKDFQEVMLEFCFVALFGVVFPLMPLLNLLVTMVEIRSDAYKLTHVYRRTWPDPAPDGVGAWNTIQRCITFGCVITNVLLTGLVTIGYHRSLVFKLTFSLMLLLVTLAFKEYLEYRFPVTSKKYRTQKARAHVVHFEAIWGTKHMEGKATPIGF